MSNQIFDAILANYKKANKSYKQKLLMKYGFDNEVDFLKFLTDGEIKKPSNQGRPKPAAKLKTPKAVAIIGKPTVHLVDIVDASGSMSGLKINNANKGMKSDVEEAQKENGKDVLYTHTLISFSGSGDLITHNYMKPVADCYPTTIHTRGMTALYETVGTTLDKLRGDVPKADKVLVKIYTDGGENGSKGKWSDASKVAELVKQLETEGFTITFIGTERDVMTVVNKININLTNTLTYDGTADGLYTSMELASKARSLYSTALSKGEDVSKNFFKRVGTL